MSRRGLLLSLTLVLMMLAGLGLSPFTGTAAADTLDDIKKRGRMIVAIDPTFPPYEYTDEQGNVVGYDPAILELIAEDFGVKIEYQKMAFVGIIPGLIAGSFDFTPTALNVTAERAKRIAYTVPVSKSVNVILKRADDSRIQEPKPEALTGLRLAVKTTTQPEQVMKAINEQLKAKGLKPFTILSVDTVEQTIQALVNERVDFVVDDTAVIAQVMKQRSEPLAVVGEIGPTQYIAWGTRKSDPKLTAYLSEQITRLKREKRLNELQKKYLGVTLDLPDEDFIPKE